MSFIETDAHPLARLGWGKAEFAAVTQCRAKQYSDQMVCEKCAQVWDMNDPHPPACRKVQQQEVIFDRKKPDDTEGGDWW